MCGIVGYFGRVQGDLAPALQRAAAMIRHRGPDDYGVWCDDSAPLGLAHRRLSIQDVSQAGHQPMVSRCGRWVLVYNGEIYNHLDLRRRLEEEGAGQSSRTESTEGSMWRGHSDTETILACFSRWGVEKSLGLIEGMFAIALWDRKERCLYLARDRMGEKPLYLGWVGSGLAFASELKALRALPGFQARIDRLALSAYLARNVVPAPFTIYEGIVKLPPAHWTMISEQEVAARQLPRPRCFWDLPGIARRGIENPMRFESDKAAITALDAVLSAAVRSQMLSDVPLGAFLSGGVDSSTIVAMMQSHSSRPVKTYSVGFHEADFNEAEHARDVARHLGTDHQDMYVDDATAREVIPLLPEMYCEPFADPSQIPTYIVASLARQQVTVSLSGDGGDELFGGYNRYADALTIWSTLQRVPAPLRPWIARAVLAVPTGMWSVGGGVASPLRQLRNVSIGHKLHRAAMFLKAKDCLEFYRTHFNEYWPSSVVHGGGCHYTESLAHLAGLPPLELMMLDDSLHYLPDDILVKVDRAAMATSLETRVPLLDRRVVEFAWKLPRHYKVRDGSGKWILRQVLSRYVPSEIVDRPKKGFSVPIESWLRGPLREWAGDLLEPARLRREGYLDAALVSERWDQHQSGRHSWHHQLWGVLMFQAWLEHQG